MTIPDYQRPNLGLLQSNFTTPPRVGNLSQPIPIGGNCYVRSPRQDLFTHTNPITTPSKTPIQDILLASFFPNKLVERYTNPYFLNKTLQENPDLRRLLNTQGLSGSICPENVQAITSSHLIKTRDTALSVLKLANPTHTQQDAQNLAIAALLHDVGKAFIPPEILNKQGTLTQEERDIINIHDELSCEILKSTELCPQILEMVQNHHSQKGAKATPELTQILKISDIYSALKEERPYKKAYTDEEAFAVLDECVAKGEVDKKYVDALKTSLNENIVV